MTASCRSPTRGTPTVRRSRCSSAAIAAMVAGRRPPPTSSTTPASTSASPACPSARPAQVGSRPRRRLCDHRQHAAHADAAYKFLAYITSGPVLAKVVTTGVPARKSAWGRAVGAHGRLRRKGAGFCAAFNAAKGSFQVMDIQNQHHERTSGTAPSRRAHCAMKI